MGEQFATYIQTVQEKDLEFVQEIYDQLTQNDLCTCEIKPAKSGSVVSFIRKDTKKTLANLVTRKAGMKLRIYADHVRQYEDFLDTIPEKMKKEIKKASICKRLVNPEDCNPRCFMGYTFHLDGELYKKCRYMAFMITLSLENSPFILQILEKELNCQ